jgi:hypothetical protein
MIYKRSPHSWKQRSVINFSIMIILEDGTNIDNWSYDDLVAVVAEFRQ